MYMHMLKLLYNTLSTSQTLLNIWRTSQNCSISSTTAVECQMPPYGELKLTLPTFGISTCCFAVHRLFDSHSLRPGLWQLYSTWAIYLEVSTVIPVIGDNVQRETLSVLSHSGNYYFGMIFHGHFECGNVTDGLFMHAIHPQTFLRPLHGLTTSCRASVQPPATYTTSSRIFKLVCAGSRQN